MPQSGENDNDERSAFSRDSHSGDTDKDNDDGGNSQRVERGGNDSLASGGAANTNSEAENSSPRRETVKQDGASEPLGKREGENGTDGAEGASSDEKQSRSSKVADSSSRRSSASHKQEDALKPLDEEEPGAAPKKEDGTESEKEGKGDGGMSENKSDSVDTAVTTADVDKNNNTESKAEEKDDATSGQGTEAAGAETAEEKISTIPSTASAVGATSSGSTHSKDAIKKQNAVKDVPKKDQGERDARNMGEGKKELPKLTIDTGNGDLLKEAENDPAEASGEDSIGYDDEDHELMDVDLDKPWLKPSVDAAKAYRKRLIWNQGMRSYFGTTLTDLGSMGVGMYLYFWVIRIMAVFFFFCSILSLPAIILNNEGNAGMAISETEVDSLGLVSLSYGNQGVNPDLVVDAECLSGNGTVDCTGYSVQVFGEAQSALQVGYIVVGTEVVIAVCFIIFMVMLSDKLEDKIVEIDDANVTPSDYSIMVRGLPPDVTKEEVRRHFHDRYSLTEPGPTFPFMGVSVEGVGVFWASTLGLLFGVLGAPSVVAQMNMTGGEAAVAGVLVMLACVLGVYVIATCFGIGRPHPRETPTQMWEKERHLRARETDRVQKQDKWNKSAAKYATARVLPMEWAPEEPDVNTTDGAPPPEAGGAVGFPEGAVGQDADVNKMEEGDGGRRAGTGAGTDIIPSARGPGGHDGLEDAPPPEPKPCQRCLNTHDGNFIGSWVADVTLGNPVGEVLRGFMEEEANVAKISKARAAVRQWKTLNKPKKLKKAIKKLEKLEKTEKALMEATRKKQDPSVVCDKISVAFVTFEHEESKARCLEDYRYSRSSFGRRFQPRQLRLCRKPRELPPVDEAEAVAQDEPAKKKEKTKKAPPKPKSTYFPLKVLEAPEPSDVKWENLDTPPLQRRLRRFLTWMVCVVLLILSFIVIYVAQTQQTALAAQIPTLDMCHETIPAVMFGTYDFPTDAVLKRDESMDSVCASDSFYLSYSAILGNTSVGNTSSAEVLLDYDSLPLIYDTDGVSSVSRVAYDVDGLCDDSGCTPTSGGSTCKALACVEESWKRQSYECITYLKSAMVGCFCLDAVVNAFEDYGLVEGAKKVATEQGAICTPFLRDYAKANAVKIFAVLAVVIVNTLLTGVMAKLAKFERHVSLSDYTSTVTVKLALAQFLNTALIVIIVNAGYTGGGLGVLQDLGLLDGSYSDFERSWYATVGVAVAMTMLINVIVPHIGPLVGEIIVKPVKRLLKQGSTSTQTQLNTLFQPPKFDMETRYAFLLQVLGVSLLYSGGIPILYLFAAFSFATNFIVDKLWITRLARKPPMYTQSLARMFVGILPLALLMHMAVTCYMLGNGNILNIGYVSDDAEAFASSEDVKGITDLVASHVLRKHVFPLFVATVLYVMLYIAFKIVGDPLLRILMLVFGTILRCFCKKKRNTAASDVWNQTPGYTAPFFKSLRSGEVIASDLRKLGWTASEDGTKAHWLFTDAPAPKGVKTKPGVPRQTWQAIAELGQYNYVMEESESCGTASRYMATAGFLSPRMKERIAWKEEKANKAALQLSLANAQPASAEPEEAKASPAREDTPVPPLTEASVPKATETAPEGAASVSKKDEASTGGTKDDRDVDRTKNGAEKGKENVDEAEKDQHIPEVNGDAQTKDSEKQTEAPPSGRECEETTSDAAENEGTEGKEGATAGDGDAKVDSTSKQAKDDADDRISGGNNLDKGNGEGKKSDGDSQGNDPENGGSSAGDNDASSDKDSDGEDKGAGSGDSAAKGKDAEDRNNAGELSEDGLDKTTTSSKHDKDSGGEGGGDDASAAKDDENTGVPSQKEGNGDGNDDSVEKDPSANHEDSVPEPTE